MNILKKFVHYINEKVDGKMEILQKICLIITIIGAVNWGLIGIFDFNLVETIFGIKTMLTKIIYIIVGIAGLINIGLLFNNLEEKRI